MGLLGGRRAVARLRGAPLRRAGAPLGRRSGKWEVGSGKCFTAAEDGRLAGPYPKRVSDGVIRCVQCSTSRVLGFKWRLAQLLYVQKASIGR